jgi:molybdate transport system regulatory protein
MHRGTIALGPGKIDLLRAIEAHESISKAAKSLGMSYMRAWTLVKIMNAVFREPLVELKRGGAQGGKAQVTDLGRVVLELYSDLVEKCQAASQETWIDVQKRLSK